uniref:Uncharacterized protein n=1 Tax=Solanum tuberosum TaxID=4113 RepID=M1DT36_SOLTU
MEAVWHAWMPMKEFNALKELPVGQHHAWMIAWNVGGLTKRGRASEECAPFGELENISTTRQNPLARYPKIAKFLRSYKGENCSLGELKTIGGSPSGLTDGFQTAQSSSSFLAKARSRVPRRTYWAHRRAIRRARLGSPIGPIWVTFGSHLWYIKLFNVDPRRPILRPKVGICRALGLDLVLDDGYNMNYITLDVVAYLGLPRLQRTYPYTMEGCTSVINGGTQIPAKEPTVEGVMDALMECSNIQSKKDLSCGHQGTIANLNTFTIANEQSVNVSLSLCEHIDYLPSVGNVLVENVDTLVDSIDDRIDSSSKIDLYPPSVDIYTFNASSLLCIDCVDQPVCKCSSLVAGPCNVIKEPQVGGTSENIDHLIRSDSLSISIAEDPVACFAHRNHVLENASKIDMCLSEDDEITPSDVPSGVNLESNIVLDSYTCYSIPLWCEAFPSKDGNLFLEDESTLVGKEGDEEKCGVCFPVTTSSRCVSLVHSMINVFEHIGSHTHKNTLEEVNL